MLTVIITANSIDQAKQHITAATAHAEIIEWRLDFLDAIDIPAIHALCDQLQRPIIFTLRRRSDGGHFNGDESSRLSLLRQLASCQPDYMDIEHDVCNEVLLEIKRTAPHLKLIHSYHNFTHTPEDLACVFKSLQHSAISHYKIVTQAKSSLDSLRLLYFIQSHSTAYNLSGHCMGEAGFFSRVLGPVVGSEFTYALLDDAATVLDVPTVSALTHNRYKEINKNTAIYALLGDPITNSPSDTLHNNYFTAANVNAVYVKIPLTTPELSKFFLSIQTLNFHGFSVTIPLKQSILSFIDTYPDHCQAVNTLKISDEISATNTDGQGAVEALLHHTSLENKKILLLGAGGTATGIMQALSEYNCSVVITNRRHEKAEHLASCYQQSAKKITDIAAQNFDIIISSLPISAYADRSLLSQLKRHLSIGTTVMDVIYCPKHTPLLQQAEKAGCRCIVGMDMLLNQAKAQQGFWSTLLPGG